MKKLKLVLIGFLLVLLLVGCQRGSDETETFNPFLDERFSGYTSDLTFEVKYQEAASNNSDLYFSSDIYDINFKHIVNKFCFKVDIDDLKFENATYYFILRDVEQATIKEEKSLFIADSKVTVSMCFNNVDSADEYELLLGKIDADLDSASKTMKVSSTITFSLDSYNERQQIKDISLNQSKAEYDPIKDIPTVAISPTITVEEGVLRKLRIEVIYQYFQLTVYQFHLDVEDLTRSNNAYQLPKEILALTPNTNYKVNIYATGHDGVDGFEDVLIYEEKIKSVDLEQITKSYHGFYGILWSHEKLEDVTRFTFSFVNQGYIKNDKNETILVVLRVYPSADSTEHVYSTTMNSRQNHTLDIDNTYLKNNYVLKMQNISGSIVLTEYELPDDFEGE